MGITPSIQIFAYQKFPPKYISEIYDQNKYSYETSSYFDYFDTEDVKILIYRINGSMEDIQM